MYTTKIQVQTSNKQNKKITTKNKTNIANFSYNILTTMSNRREKESKKKRGKKGTNILTTIQKREKQKKMNKQITR